MGTDPEAYKRAAYPPPLKPPDEGPFSIEDVVVEDSPRPLIGSAKKARRVRAARGNPKGKKHEAR